MAVLPFQHGRGTTAKLNAYVGAPGEILFDTVTKQLCVQDGSTRGGIRLAKEEDATQQTHGLMSAADKTKLDVLQTQVASLVSQVETLSDTLSTLLAQVDSYYNGYDGYPRS